MKKLTTLLSPAVPMMKSNIDTDIITPMHRMTARSTKPLHHYAFEPLRYIDGDGDQSILNPQFPMNDHKYKNATIMLCGENFGCGSSRETAPAAIADLGFRCLIGSSFGDIFFNNCFQQSILPIVLDLETIKTLVIEAETGTQFFVDLEKQVIQIPNKQIIAFTINPMKKRSLLQGLDDIELTLSFKNDIEEWQRQDQKKRPWAYPLLA